MAETAQAAPRPQAGFTEADITAINTIRTLAMDAVQQANSGHPGTPMALAPVAYCLWQEFLRYDPSQPLWPGRDRFVLGKSRVRQDLEQVIPMPFAQLFFQIEPTMLLKRLPVVLVFRINEHRSILFFDHQVWH